MKRILAIDQGTTATKTYTLDTGGHFVFRRSEDHPQIYPQAGWVEHDPEEIWSSQAAVSAEQSRGRLTAGVLQLGVLDESEAVRRRPGVAEHQIEVVVRAEADMLEERRASAQEEHIDLELALGRHDEMIPILAVGETLEQREAEVTEEIIVGINRYASAEEGSKIPTLKIALETETSQVERVKAWREQRDSAKAEAGLAAVKAACESDANVTPGESYEMFTALQVQGKPVEMVAGYDEFTPRAYAYYPGGTSLQRWHRRLLRRALEAEGENEGARTRLDGLERGVTWRFFRSDQHASSA